MPANDATKTPVPQAITTPSKVETGIGNLEFTDGYPTGETAEKLRDHLDYLHGVETFMIHRRPAPQLHCGLATRQWVNQLQQPPSEFAKLKWRQARTATAAGAKAWRSGAPTQSTSSMLGTSDSQRRSDDRISQSNERERHGHWTGAAHRLGLQPPRLSW